MHYHIVEAPYVIGHVVWLRFRDGTSGEIYLAPALRGPIFEPLRDPAVFSQRVAIRVIRLRDELICGPFSSRGNEQVGISISRTAEEGKLRLPLRYPLNTSTPPGARPQLSRPDTFWKS